MKRSKWCKYCYYNYPPYPLPCNNAENNNPCKDYIEKVTSRSAIKIQAYRDWLAKRIKYVRGVIRLWKGVATVNDNMTELYTLRQCAKQLREKTE